MNRFSLEQIELEAKGKPIVAITIHYENRKASVCYSWDDRFKIKWNNVRKVRLDFKEPKIYYINGEVARRPGFRISK